MQKICIKCNTERDIEEFPPYKKRNGEKGYRNVCRECFNKQDRANRKTETQKEIKTVTYTKPDNDLTASLQLTSAEILELKQIVKERIRLNTDITHSKRIVKSFNIDESLFKLIVESAKNNKLSNSDILNKVLQDFFNKV